MKKNYILAFLLALPFLLSAQTTNVLKDINESGSSTPKYLVSDETNLYYSANDGLSGQEIVVSDGTSANTAVVDAYEGTYLTGPFGQTPTQQPAGTDMRNAVVFKGKLYYKGAKSYTYNALYGVDVADWATLTFNASTETSDVVFDSPVIKTSLVHNETLYFCGDDNVLYSWDGVAATPTVLPNQQGVFTCYNGNFEVVGNYLIISGTMLVDDAATADVDESTFGNEMLAYNLEDNSCKVLGDLTPNGNSNILKENMAAMRTYYMFFTVGGKLYVFSTSTGELFDLYEGSFAKPDLDGVYVYKNLHVWNDKLYFGGKDVDAQGNTVYNYQLYSYDPLPATNYLKRVSTIEVAGTYKAHFPQLYVNDGSNYLYYVGQNGSGYRLFRTDGTAVESVNAKVAANTSTVPVVFNGRVYFVGTDDGTYGLEVYVYDPSGTPTAIDDVDNKAVSLNIYPNPSNGFVNVEGLSAASATYEIYNLTGQCVETGVIKNTVLDYDVSNGIYILKVTDGISSVVKKISVQ